MKILYKGPKAKVSISFPIGFQSRKQIVKTIDFYREIPVEVTAAEAKALLSTLESPFIKDEESKIVDVVPNPPTKKGRSKKETVYFKPPYEHSKESPKLDTAQKDEFLDNLRKSLGEEVYANVGLQ